MREMFRRLAASNFLRNFICSPRSFPFDRQAAANALPIPLSAISKTRVSDQHGFGMNHRYPHLWMILCGQAAVVLGMNANPVLAQDASVGSSFGNDYGGAGTDLSRFDEASLISNIHTSKWRVFTDAGRDFFLQGKVEEAIKLFQGALQEAKEGFGERDAHVASACNNLAELYRLQKAFDKAEPLYLEAINILEESFGPEDIRVGAALHNLGHFYVVERKLDQARACYERALKIKRRALGLEHSEYAETMYQLGMVLYQLGKIKDSESLVQDSIRILEENGNGESTICIRRLRFLAQIYIMSNRPTEAENIQRKILHIMELSKGWNSLETVVAAEVLALTLQSGNLTEAQELLERCLDARKTLLPDDHIQIGANMLHIAKLAMLKSNQLSKTNISEAITELDKAKDLLDKSIRIAQGALNKINKKGKAQNYGEPGLTKRNGRVALLILLRSLDAIGLVETSKQELQKSKEVHSLVEAENAFLRCISTYKEFGNEGSVFYSRESKAEYLSCLKHLSSLVVDSNSKGTQQTRRSSLQELKDEINRVEVEMSHDVKRRS